MSFKNWKSGAFDLQEKHVCWGLGFWHLKLDLFSQVPKVGRLQLRILAAFRLRAREPCGSLGSQLGSGKGGWVDVYKNPGLMELFV